MSSEHIVRSFDDQLRRLENLIAEMGGLAEAQLADAIDAMSKRDLEKAARVTAEDRRIDELETLIDHEAIALLALRQPMATDLREVVGALKAAGIVPRDVIDAKVILSGKLSRKVMLKGIKVTKGARAAIEAAGGQVEDLPQAAPKAAKE